jgi:hypothetical protein
MVKCSKAISEKCQEPKTCPHAKPHEIKKYGFKKCSCWGTCYNDDYGETRVRCQKVD